MDRDPSGHTRYGSPNKHRGFGTLVTVLVCIAFGITVGYYLLVQLHIWGSQ